MGILTFGRGIGSAFIERQQIAAVQHASKFAGLPVFETTGCRAMTEEEFVATRNARNATLEVPALIRPSLQVNVRSEQLPRANDTGIVYLQMTLNASPRQKRTCMSSNAQIEAPRSGR